MDRSSWECAILHGSCVENYGTVGLWDFDRVGTGALGRPSRAKLGKLVAGVTPRSKGGARPLEFYDPSSLCCLADALGAAILGNVCLLRRSHLQQRFAPHMHKA